MILTRQNIHECSTPAGGWNKAQLAVIGIDWPPVKGWIGGLEGTEITDEEFNELKQLATLKVKKKSTREDKNVEAVRAKLQSRMKTGLRKYGVTTERADLSRKQWLIHAQEEAMDLAVYLERLIQDEA